MSNVKGLPDLLRRFVATPYSFGVILNSTVISFETNEEELLAIFRARAEELAGVLSLHCKSWLWKILRDGEIRHSNHKLLLLTDEDKTTLFFGTGTVFAIDWRRGEILGFVVKDVSAQRLLDMLIDAARRHHSSLQCEQ